MQSALKLTARVLAGNRVEFTSPDLVVGEDVEVIVLKPANGTSVQLKRQFKDVAEYLDSLPNLERTPEEWMQPREVSFHR